jgi:hypothetical protein
MPSSAMASMSMPYDPRHHHHMNNNMASSLMPYDPHHPHHMNNNMPSSSMPYDPHHYDPYHHYDPHHDDPYHYMKTPPQSMPTTPSMSYEFLTKSQKAKRSWMLYTLIGKTLLERKVLGRKKPNHMQCSSRTLQK